MPTYINPQAWSTTANSNDGADSGFGAIADTSYPRAVLDWYRGNMAAFKRYASDTGGALMAGGSANALTVTTNQALSSAHVAAGAFLVVRAAEANTSATVTFSPDGLTAAAIKCTDGSALVIGQIKAGMPLLLFYNAGSSEWRAANLISGSSSDLGSTTASFQATKSGTDQIIPTDTTTKVTFSVEVFDNGSLYSESSSRWTPPAGKVLIIAAVRFETVQQDEDAYLHIYKNGAAYKTLYVTSGQSANRELTQTISVVDAASGSDYYEIYARRGTGYVNKIISGTMNETWFCGTMV